MAQATVAGLGAAEREALIETNYSRSSGSLPSASSSEPATAPAGGGVAAGTSVGSAPAVAAPVNIDSITATAAAAAAAAGGGGPSSAPTTDSSHSASNPSASASNVTSNVSNSHPQNHSHNTTYNHSTSGSSSTSNSSHANRTPEEIQYQRGRETLISEVRQDWKTYLEAETNKSKPLPTRLKSFFEINQLKNGLIIYGPAFEGLSYDPSIHRDKEKFNQSLGLVHSVTFKYVDFKKCVQQFPKLQKFYKLACITFDSNNLRFLHQLDSLSQFNLEELNITNNPLCEFSTSRLYAIARLHCLQRMDGVPLEQEEIDKANLHFGPLREFLKEGCVGVLPGLEDPTTRGGPYTSTAGFRLPDGSPMGTSSKTRKMVRRYVDDTVKEAIASYEKIEEFHKLWPEVISGYIKATLTSIDDGRQIGVAGSDWDAP